MKDELRLHQPLIEQSLTDASAQPTQDIRLPWRAPRVTRIDIKRTMLGGNSMSEGSGRSTP
jgi:hypothetical protein